jgi:hypothetical protein
MANCYQVKQCNIVLSDEFCEGESTMLKRRRALLKQRKPAGWSPRRKILMQDLRRKILRRNNAYFLTQATAE